MAQYHEVITSGIALSHVLSKENPGIYEITKEEPVPKINIDALLEVVLNYLKKIDSPIKDIYVGTWDGFPHGNTYGLVDVTGGVAQIVINSKLNKCWERFTICKELLQLYCDGGIEASKLHYQKKEIRLQINELVSLQNNLFINSTNVSQLMQLFDDKSASELTATMVAIDLIFPVNEKKGFVSNINDFIENNEVPTYNVAYVFRMPEFIITTYYKNFHSTSLGMIMP